MTSWLGFFFKFFGLNCLNERFTFHLLSREYFDVVNKEQVVRSMISEVVLPLFQFLGNLYRRFYPQIRLIKG